MSIPENPNARLNRRRCLSAPGAWADDDGTLHLDLGEMCIAAGYAPTEENQSTLKASIVDAASDPDGPFTVVE